MQKYKDFSDGTYAAYNGTIVADSTGNYAIPIDQLASAYEYNTDGTLKSITVGPDSQGNYFKQSYTYSGANIATVSAWVKQ